MIYYVKYVKLVTITKYKIHSMKMLITGTLLTVSLLLFSGHLMGNDSDNDEQRESTEEKDDDSESDLDVGADPVEIDFRSEAEVAKKVLENLINSSMSTSEPPEKSVSVSPSMGGKSTEVKNASTSKSSKLLNVPVQNGGGLESKDATRSVTTNNETGKEDADLDRTVFISNLPFDVSAEEVKQRFSIFGEVQSCFPVLHQLTKYVCPFLYLVLCFLP